MTSTARAAISFFLGALPLVALGQAGPADPQVIAAVDTARISIGQRKLEGHLIGNVRVGEDGRVRNVAVTANTADPGFEPQLIKVLESARFRPAIDASGQLVEGTIEMKVELLQATAQRPKPMAANPDPQFTEKEGERILKMTCPDFVWEWELLRGLVGNSAATEAMPRVAITMYARLRSDNGEYVGADVWKESAKALRESADRCKENPQALFWQGTLKPVLDEAVPR